MPYKTRRITPDDLMAPHEYSRVRAQRRQGLESTKTLRRIQVGPFITFYFESFDTIWFQIQEMLHIEGGGIAQVPGELEAYNPLIPKGHEFVATMMIEIDNAKRRERELNQLGGIEKSVLLQIDNQVVPGISENDVQRTKASGRTSSVHFLRFPMTPSQSYQARNPNHTMILDIKHDKYPHLTRIGDAEREELCKDLD